MENYSFLVNPSFNEADPSSNKGPNIIADTD
jgi:hypothetical protein